MADYFQLVGRTLIVPAGACGRSWAEKEFADKDKPLEHPLDAVIEAYDPRERESKRFTVTGLGIYARQHPPPVGLPYDRCQRRHS